MLSNFIQMPGFLKFLTGMVLVCTLSLVLSMLPGYIDLFGRHISVTNWWSNGSGFVFAISLIPMISSGILMLKRSIYGRIVHIFGWIFADIGVLAVVILNDITVPTNDAYIYASFSIASIIVFSGYLYFSKRVRAYFS